jgi:hypothetical protein
MTLNYPIQLEELPVPPSGAVRHVAPANVPLFEDLRRADRSVPLTTLGDGHVGGAFVMGMNYGRPGTTVRCVGCHIGHTQIPVPPTAEAARWSNLAPGARVTVSAIGSGNPRRLVNRRARLERSFDHWRSPAGATAGQWAELEFPVPVLVRTVRLHAPGDGVQVDEATVRLYPDTGRSSIVASATSGRVVSTGTDVPFADVQARVVRVEFTRVQGPHTSLAEIEVVAAGVGDVAPTVPAAPRALTIASASGNTVVLRWLPPPGVPPDAYVVEGGMNPGEVLASLPTGSGAPRVEFAAPTGRYYVRVHAISGGMRSGPSNEVLIRPGIADPPSAPDLVTGLAEGNVLHLSWKNTFEGGPLEGLHLMVDGAPLLTLDRSAESFTYRGVPPGTYTLALRGVGLGGTAGPVSNPVTITFPGQCNSAPLAPGALVAFAAGNELSVLWDPPAGGPAHAGYVLDVEGAYTASLALTGRAVSGRVGPGTYTLRVRAVNACGTSPASPAQTVAVP